MGFLLAALPPRMVPVFASGAIHASLAVSLLTTAVAHRAPPADSSIAITLETVDVATPETVTPVAPDVAPPPEAPAAAVHATHTHPYPVSASHDEEPHDPSLAHTAPAEPAAAPAVAVAPADALSPRFTIAFGASASPAAVVATGATGTDIGDAHGHDHGRGDGEEETVTESMVSVAAKLVAGGAPSYPPSARANEVEAEVPVDILVDTSGRVVEAKVHTKAGYGFDESAVAAVRGYRFSAAQRNGKPVRVQMRWTVQFRLR